MKGLDKTEVHLFRFDEVKHLEEVDLKQIRKFTFAPFTPLFLYQFFQRGYDFIILHLAFHGIFYSLFLIAIRIRNSIILNTQINFLQDITKDPHITQKMIDQAKGFRQMNSLFSIRFWQEWVYHKSFLLICLGIGLLISLLVTLFVCTKASQMSWNRNEWKDREAYTQSQKRWNLIGLVCFIATILAYILLFIWLGQTGRVVKI